MVVFDLERVFLQDGDDFADREFSFIFFQDFSEGFLLGDAFESDEVVEIFSDVGHLLETHSFDPLLFAR